MRYWRYNWRYELSKRWERFIMAIVWRLPRVVVMWAFVRMTVTSCPDDENPTMQTASDTMKRWEAA